jgi:hypothetical protein
MSNPNFDKLRQVIVDLKDIADDCDERTPVIVEGGVMSLAFDAERLLELWKRSLNKSGIALNSTSR